VGTVVAAAVAEAKHDDDEIIVGGGVERHGAENVEVVEVCGGVDSGTVGHQDDRISI
jgi:hypothetical protein